MHQPYIDKSYLYLKDPFEGKCQLFINKHKGVGLTHYNDSKAFIEHSDDIYENIEEYNLNNERKKLIVFNNMIADMLRNKKKINK